jgi:hypothetical protein
VPPSVRRRPSAYPMRHGAGDGADRPRLKILATPRVGPGSGLAGPGTTDVGRYPGYRSTHLSGPPGPRAWKFAVAESVGGVRPYYLGGHRRSRLPGRGHARVEVPV